MENGELYQNGDQLSIALNLMNVAATGNATFLDMLLKSKFDPNIRDSRGRTPLVRIYDLNVKYLLLSYSSLNSSC